jgi:hypothetical protein
MSGAAWWWPSDAGAGHRPRRRRGGRAVPGPRRLPGRGGPLVSPKVRVRAAWVLLVLCLIGWPVSLFSFAATEPPWVLSLSWGAMILTCVDIVSTTDVRKQQDDDNQGNEA